VGVDDARAESAAWEAAGRDVDLEQFAVILTFQRSAFTISQTGLLTAES